MLINALLVMSVLFVLLLLAKKVTGIRFCVLCVSVALTWVGIFILVKINHVHDLTLLALLLGESVTGIFYFTQSWVAKDLRIFSLPFFLTLTTLAYYLVNPINRILPILVLLFGLWLAAWLVFIYRNDPGKKPLAESVLDCCNEK